MIDINNVIFKYNGAEDNVLENFHLTVKQGEFVVLAGASGCGKTTVTRLINKLIPEFYDGEFSGTVTLDKTDLATVEIDCLAGLVGSVFQDPRSQFFATETAAEVAFSCENLNLDFNEIRSRMDSAIDDLKINHLIGKSIFELSSGEKQSIAIASVNTLSPKILVLDEPSSNLDMKAVENLKRTLGSLKEKGVTIVISEHRLNYLNGLADRVLFFENSKKIKPYTGEDFYNLSNTNVNLMGLRSLYLKDIIPTKKTCTKDKIAVSIKSLNFGYKKGNSILKNIDLDINAGNVVGLIGANGAGKSTLMNIICGLQKQKNGDVLFGAQKTTANKRSLNSYLVMQNSDCQLFTEKVEKELFLGKKFTESEKSSGIEILKSLNLDNLLDRHPASLSGGQKQRLAIALSYFKKSTIICMDEPTSGLDYNSMDKVANFILNLSAENQSFLIASHDFEFLAKACTHICLLKEGEIKEFFSLNSNTISKLYDILYL